MRDDGKYGKTFPGIILLVNTANDDEVTLVQKAVANRVRPFEEWKEKSVYFYQQEIL